MISYSEVKQREIAFVGVHVALLFLNVAPQQDFTRVFENRSANGNQWNLSVSKLNASCCTGTDGSIMVLLTQERFQRLFIVIAEILAVLQKFTAVTIDMSG